MLRLVLVLILIGLGSAIPTKAAAKSRVPLDTSVIRKTYIDGDFDRAIEDIERALKWGGPFSQPDSVFMFKHLGVMYAAKYETREKGKHYMLQLLTVEPAARILDMYASDMIYMIFKNIQTEFEATQGRLLVDNGDLVRTPTAKVSKRESQPKSRAWIGWTAGAVAAAGGIALTLHLIDEASASPKEHIPE